MKAKQTEKTKTTRGVAPAAKPIQGAKPRKSLNDRYEESYRTRFRGHEEKGTGVAYSSTLSDGPVAFVDRIVIKAPVSELPLRPDYRQKFRGMRKGREREFYLDEPHRLDDFIVHIGSTKAGQQLYLTCTAIPLRRRIPSVFIGALVHLARREVLDLGPPSSQRRRACDLLRLFIVSELELRVDLNHRAGQKLMNQLGEYRDEKGHFKLSSWARRHEAGALLKLYDKSEPVVRFEVVLYSKFFATESSATELSTSRVTFQRWWPKAMEWIKKVERNGHKPELANLREAVDKWVPLTDRIRVLEIGDIAEKMIREGAKAKMF
ncbi:MAG TPA: hypothetical protein VMV44_01600 [Rectinemataceae bacterium]|nr:hypothetical protein [Rectinemataceae bacterium]